MKATVFYYFILFSLSTSITECDSFKQLFLNSVILHVDACSLSCQSTLHSYALYVKLLDITSERFSGVISNIRTCRLKACETCIFKSKDNILN